MAALGNTPTLPIRPAAERTDFLAPDAQAVRWVEAQLNLNCLLQLKSNLTEEYRQGEEAVKVLKRLTGRILLSTGYYPDELAYAHTLDALEAVIRKALMEAATRIRLYWRPGMPGYGLESQAVDQRLDCLQRLYRTGMVLERAKAGGAAWAVYDRRTDTELT